ncbi:MAG: hypothetical protein ACR2G3_10135 [Solirubrobacterales bacterium]
MSRAVKLWSGILASVGALVLPALATANVRADFNDDGFEDLAIGIEGEELTTPTVINGESLAAGW